MYGQSWRTKLDSGGQEGRGRDVAVTMTECGPTVCLYLPAVTATRMGGQLPSALDKSDHVPPPPRASASLSA